MTVLLAVAKVYPGEVERARLDEATGYKRSTRNRLIAELCAMKLVTVRQQYVRASDKLFDATQPGGDG